MYLGSNGATEMQMSEGSAVVAGAPEEVLEAFNRFRDLDTRSNTRFAPFLRKGAADSSASRIPPGQH